MTREVMSTMGETQQERRRNERDSGTMRDAQQERQHASATIN